VWTNIAAIKALPTTRIFAQAGHNVSNFWKIKGTILYLCLRAQSPACANMPERYLQAEESLPKMKRKTDKDEKLKKVMYKCNVFVFFASI